MNPAKPVFCALMLWMPAMTLADTLVLHDGRRLPGEVRQTADGYVVKTRFGTTITVETNEVREWIRENPAATTTSTRPPVSSNHTKPATTQAATRPASRTIDGLIRQGADALLAREYKIAREIFADAVSVEPRNVKALHGMALTLMYLNDFKGAQVWMERALSAAGSKPDRALILNNAMLQIALNNPMRAVKFTREYIEANFKAIDEPMLNALGSALFLADDNARKNMLWNTTVDLFMKYQKALEATKPGMKRWGVEWLAAADVDKKFGEMRKQETIADRILQQLDLVEDRVIRAKRNLRQARADQLRGSATALEVNIAQVNLTEKLTEYHNLAKAFDEAMDGIARPTWPRVLTPVGLDDVNPPAADSGNLAMNDPLYKEAIAKAGKSNAPKRALMEPDDQPKTVSPPEMQAPPPAVVAIKTPKAQKVRVQAHAAAFAVSPALVVTAAGPLENAVEFELQGSDGAAVKAEVVKTDAKTGLALLKVKGKPLAYIAIGESTANGPIQCAGFPQVSLFGPVAEMLPGLGTPVKDGAFTVRLMKHPRLMASPLIANKKVVGVVMATREHALDALPALSLETLKSFLTEVARDLPVAGASDPTAAMLQLIAIREGSTGTE